MEHYIKNIAIYLQELLSAHPIISKIKAKALIITTILLFAGGLLEVNAAIFTSKQTGNWNTASSWTQSGSDSDGIPDSGDNVIVLDGHTITVTATTSCTALTLYEGATITINSTRTLTFTSLTTYCGTSNAPVINGAGTLIIGGNLTVNSAGTGSSGASISSLVSLSGNRTFSVADDGTDAEDLTISGVISGTSNYRGITKTGDGQALFSGSNSFGGALIINAGTIIANTIANRYSNSSLGSGYGTTAITIGSSGILKFIGTSDMSTNRLITLSGSGATIDASGTGEMTLAGNITGNTYNLNLTGTGNGVVSSVIGTTSGAVSKNGSGNWTLSGSNTFTGSTNINEGTLLLGANGTTTNTPLGTTGSGTIVASGACLDLNGYTLGTSESLTLNGTGISNGGALINSSTTESTYYGAIILGSATTITPTGNITLGSIGISGGYDLTKTGSGSLSLGSGTVTIGTMTISQGTLTSTSGTMYVSGDFTNNATFSSNSGTVQLNGSSAQIINGNSSSFYNLTINNTSGGVSLGASQTVTGTLTLTNGLLTLGSYNLTLGANAVAGTGFSSTKMIVADGTGELRRNYTGNGSYTFPIGDVTGTAEYSPITLNFTSGSYSSAYAAVRVINSKHPNNASNTNYLNRYWKVSSSGISSYSCNVTATYTNADISGTESAIAAGKWGGALPWTKYSAFASNTLTASNSTSLGDFTGITLAAPTVNISANPMLNVGIGESVILTANSTGDTPISYLWTPGNTTNQTLNPSTAVSGSIQYTVTVTDGNGFTVNTSATVVVVPQVLVVATSGTINGEYVNLKNAFDKINDGTHKGAIQVKIQRNTTETASAQLLASGGAVSYTGVSVYPVNSGLKISGNINGNLVYLNGADNITFDGRLNRTGSSTDLLIENTSTGTSAVTFSIDNTSQNNTLQYCTLKGSGGASTNGIINFASTGTNTGNTITLNNITKSTSGRENAIYSGGANTSNTVSSNNFYNCWSEAASSTFISLASSASDWSISGNSFYNTVTFIPTGAYNYYGINISNTASGNNFSITGNYFGGSAALCSGTMTIGSTSAQSIKFNPVNLSVGSTTATSIQGNYIRSINLYSSNVLPFTGINLISGLFNVGTVSGNNIGQSTGTGSITITGYSAATVSSVINVATANDAAISNNIIGSITVANNNTAYGHSFYGIIKNANTGALTISNNLIGSTSTTGSINCSSTATGENQILSGISTTTSSALNFIISGNTITNLTNGSTRDNAGNSVYGIICAGASTNVLSNNFIHHLSCSSSGVSNVVSGIQLTNYSGGNTLKNNIISLGAGLDGKLYAINGIYDGANTADVFYHNTSYISGTITGSTATNTFAFNNTSWITLDLKNNLFVNTRSGGSGTGKHVAVKISNAGSSQSDYNDFFVSGTNGITGINNSTTCTTLADWRTSTSKDANSLSENPAFPITAGNTASEFMPATDLYGYDLTSIVPTDYLGTTRYTDPTIGAIERPLTYKVEVYNGASLLASYMNIKSAFDKINNGTHTGALTLKVTGTTNEKAKAVLNASGTTSGGGTSSYTSVNIYPTITGVKISGALDDAIILLNGADNVTIDGRVNESGTTPDLTIQNTNASTGAVTVQIEYSAQNNIIKYSNIKGGGGAATNGTLVFGATGYNLSNTIDNCLFTNNGTRRQNAIYAATGNNIDNIFSNNQIYNNWSASATSYAVNLGAGTSGWTISGNSIYETTTLVPSAGNNYYGINISNTSGNGFTVIDNYIGGQSIQCGGSAMTMGSTSQSGIMYPIYINAGGTTATSLQGNRIKNINYSSSHATPFYGIYVNAGLVNIGNVSGNIIGDTASTGNISLISGSNAVSHGIYVASTNVVNVSNNLIGSINLTTTYNSHGFYGIRKSAVAGAITISGNKIGSILTSNSIRSTSTSASQKIAGIISEGTGNSTITGNVITNLNNTAGQSDSYLYGISSSGAGINEISGNFIYNLNLVTTVETNKLAGVHTSSGTNTVYNNIVVLGGNITDGVYSLNGLLSENSATEYFYHNTVYLSGTKSGTSSAYSNAFYKSVNGTATIKNNIFFNARTGGSGNGKHSAISLKSFTGVISDKNVLYSTGTNGVVGAIITDSYNATPYTSISDWRTASGLDASSYNINPNFVNAGGYVVANYKPKATIIGDDHTSVVPYDFEGSQRPSTPTIGAFERLSGNIDVYSGAEYKASYTTVKGAFDKINDGTHTGSLSVKINANTTESNTATLNASGTGSAIYSTISIFPTKTGLTISGSVDGVLINLNGSDNVCIDGRVNKSGTTPDLTITNASTGVSAVTYQLNNSAQNDTLRYCNVLGGGGSSSNGTILFGTTGNNSSDIVEYNNITNNGTRRVNAIYSVTGTNVSNIIRSNNIYNNWNSGSDSYSVYLGSGTNAWIISGNSIYATTSFTSGAYNYYGIYISNTSGNGYEISGNYFGGSASACGGSAFTVGTASSTMYPFYVNAGTSSATSIQGNTIRNISYTSSSTTPFYGIYVNNGLVNIGTVTGNTFGDASTGSITLTGSATALTSYGIYLANTATTNVSKNTISSITVSNTSAANAHSFYGIYKSSTAGTLNISTNVIGHSSTSSSIITSSTSTGQGQILMGIYSAGTGTVTISGNTVANLTNATTTSSSSRIRGIQTDAGANTITNNIIQKLTFQSATAITENANACQIGIQQGSISGTQTIEGNQVNSLTNNSSSRIAVYGIFYAGPTTGTNSVSNNFIYGFDIPNLYPTNSGAQGFAEGIFISAGTVNVINNVIVFGSKIPGNLTIFGINNTSSSNIKVYHNTVYIQGAVSSGVGWTFCMYENTGSTGVTRDIRNNIFWNTRTGGDAGYIHHCTIFINSSTNLTLNYNDYGWVGSFFGEFPAGTYFADLAAWRTGTGKDANSINTDPLFANPGGITPEDYKTGVELTGVTGLSVTVDYGGNTRTTPFTMGAWEYLLPPVGDVDVYVSGVFAQKYTTLKAAFDAINAGTHKGNINIRINVSTSETLTSTLNASGTGSSSFTKVLVYPTATGLSVTGNVNTPLINLNGADNVTFDGRVNASGTTPDLTIKNTYEGLNAATIVFSNSAQYDSIKYCNIKGASTSATLGNILFSTSTSGTGNDNNVIANCNITSVNNINRPLNAIVSIGSATIDNSQNSIINNNFYDHFIPAASSYGIKISSYSTAFTISGNSFYETTDFVPTTATGVNSYVFIGIENASGGGYTINGNYIGGKSSLCGGSNMVIGSSTAMRNNRVYPIQIATGNSSVSNINGNNIKNIKVYSSNDTIFSGITVRQGLVNVGTSGGNIIGSSEVNASIDIYGSATKAYSHGITSASAVQVNIENNTIAGINTNNLTTANAHDFSGVFIKNTAGAVKVSGNTIGSNSVSASVGANSAATAYDQLLFGVYSTATGNVTISGNTIANLTNFTTETTMHSKLYGIYTTAGTNIISGNTVHDIRTDGSASADNYDLVAMTGIHQRCETGAQKIIGNTIYNIISTTTAPVEFYGILHWNSTNGSDTIANNFIHSFRMLSADVTCYLHGLSFYNSGGTYTATSTVYNNIVFLGDSITTGCNIFGIVKNSLKPMNFFHNTIHLGGTVADGSTTSSYAYRDKTGGTPAMRDIRNNIFYNTRSGGGSNYSIYFYVYSSSNVLVDYNDYGWSGTYFAQIASPSSQLVTLQQWRETTGQDSHSLILDPQFFKIDGVISTDYKTNIGLDGIPGTGITTDFAGLTRSTGSPTMGAWECFPVDVYNGSTFRSSYFTLKDAFSAINNGTWTGNLSIRMKGSTLEPSTAVLNASGGTANYSKVVVYPTRSDVIIKGDMNTNLIQLNGADYVKFDGRIDTTGATANMKISNLNTGTSAGTIQMTASAQNNIIDFCIVNGAGTGTGTGVINFSTASTGSGNDNNIIRNSKITGTSLTVRPVNAIYSLGSTTAGTENSANIISNNEIYNNWNQTISSNGILIGAGSTGWIIRFNSFYDSTSFVPTAANTYTAVKIDNTSSNGNQIYSNYFGGRMPQVLGSAMTVGSTAFASIYYPIYLNVGNTSASSIQDNRITNLSVTSSAQYPFNAVYIAEGSVNIGDVTENIFGAVTGNGAITVSSSYTQAVSRSIYVGGTGTVVITNNKFGSITAANSNTANAHSIEVITGNSSGSITIDKNQLGSTTTDNSIYSTSSSTSFGQTVNGIVHSGAGSMLVKENIITNLTNASTYNNAANQINGIRHDNNGVLTILQNYISRLGSAATGTANSISGIRLNGGSATVANNVINIGSNSLGYYLIYGIYETGVSGYTNSIYHNTVFISGTVNGTVSTALTYAFYKLNDIGTSNIKNNIFFNARSTGGTSSKHYAIRLLGKTTLSINGNDYWYTGTYGTLGSYNNANITTIATWRTSTGQDGVSISSTPGFLNQGGNTALDYKINAVLSGVSGTGITIDFGGNSRDNTTPTMGAWEYSLCVEVYNGPTLRAAYSTLKGAFDKINDGTWKGDLTIKIYKNTYETATASLNATGGTASYTRVLVYPVRDSVKVEASLNAPVVSFNGATNVTLDGRLNATGTVPSITFSNSNTGTSASVIQFINAAQSDTVRYCQIKGAGKGTAAGAVFFSTSTGASGNSNNLITLCKISGQNSSERPVNSVYSEGTSGKENTGNAINDNEIFNFLIADAATNGIHIGANSNTFTISGNSFYGTSTFTSTAAVDYTMIRINNTSGGGFNISNNYIGGSAPLCASTWNKIGNNNNFYGIYVNAGTATATSIQNNRMSNMNFNNSGGANWTGIHVAAGLVNIGTITGNIIGGTSGTNSVNITNGATGGNLYAINVSGTGNVVCQNNTISSITTNCGYGANAFNFYGIYKANVAGNLTVSNNTLGSSSTLNSIQGASNAYGNSQVMYGVYSQGTGSNIISSNIISNISNLTVETTMSSKMYGIYVSAGSNTIENNTVSDLTCGGAANGGSTTSAPNIGICNVSATAGQIISGNQITRIKNTSTAKIYVVSLYYSGPTSGTNRISANFINRVLVPVAPPESYIQGISIYGGTADVYNNIVALGDSITKGCTIYGLMNNNTSAINIYHNTLYIGGTVSAAVSPTYAFRDETTSPSGTRNIRDNVISNLRSGGGTHYGIYLSSNAALTINYNDYYAGGTNGILGYYGSDKTTLAAWKSATTQDANSLNVNPLYVVPGTTTPSNYTPTASVSGIYITMISVDYLGNTRQNPPTMGALEFTGYFWTGNVDTRWDLAGNWLPQMVPTISVHANIPLRPNQPNINSGITAEVKSMLIYSGAIVTINGGGTLTIADNLVNNNGGNTGIVINSTASGTGSFIYNGDNIAATVKRYIAGDSAAWHLLSAPVSGQPIHGTPWTPSGTYGDGTGYDLYVWDEPTSCWVYNLNTTVAPTWTSVHPQGNFVPGRGYLYALLDTMSTKQFVGTLNNGNITQALTISSATDSVKGFNFLGNPYPSSIDWSMDEGFSRSMLKSNGGGFDVWVYSDTASNYGVYNSADYDGVGSNGLTKYIAPMQGFFVLASTAGNFGFNNSAKTHVGASNWLKSAPVGSVGKVRLMVSSASGKGSDEVQMRFGYNNNQDGAYKLFSHVKTAPSLYIPYSERKYSVRRLTTTEENPKTAVSFKAGADGKYSIRCEYDPAIAGTIYLEDKKTGVIHDFSLSDTYNFVASTSDSDKRFVIHYGKIVPEDDINDAAVYINSGILYVDLTLLRDEYDLQVYDLGGKLINKSLVTGGSVKEVSLRNQGVYMVSLRSQKSSVTKKVVY